MTDKRRADLRDLMSRLLQNTDGKGYAGDFPGECADRVLNLLGITPDSVIVTNEELLEARRQAYAQGFDEAGTVYPSG